MAKNSVFEDLFKPISAENLNKLLVNAYAREINSEEDRTRFSVAKSIYNNLKALGFCERDAVWMAVGEVCAWPEQEEIKTFKIDDFDHLVGDSDCVQCFGDPAKCDEKGCSGLKHKQFFEQHWDGYDLIYCCDQCGDTDEPL